MNTQDHSAAPSRLSRRFLGGALFVYLAVTLAAGWAFLLWQIGLDRDRTIQAARRQLTTIATAVAYNFAAMVHDGVGAAHAGANEIEASHASRPTRRERAAVFARMLTGGQYVLELFTLDELGYIGARRMPSGEISTFQEERPAWLSLSLHDTEDAWVGAPITTESDARVSVPIMRRVQVGARRQWVGALLSAETFQVLSKSLISEQGGVALVSHEGVILMRAPADDGLRYVGTNVSYTEGFRAAVENSDEIAIVETTHPYTLQRRLIASRRVSGYPLFATAGRDVAAVLAPWRERTAASLKIAAASSIALTILILSLFVLMRRRHEALRRSEERFQLAVTGTSDGIWDWNILAGRVYYSPRFKELLRVGAGVFPATEDAFWERVHPDHLEMMKAKLREHLIGDRPYDIEVPLRCGVDEYRWFRCRGRAVRDEAGRALRMAGSISDIHERRLTEQSLEQARMRELHAQEHYAEALLVAQENERQRLANELHDSIGQNLSIIKNRAVLALRSEDGPPAILDHVRQVSNVATEAIGELRTVTRNLLPVQVEQLGLTEALRTLVGQFTEACGIAVEARIEQVDDVLQGAEAMHVFRVVQEALSNVSKHAQASRCEIRIERDVHCVRLTIVDDGRGMALDSTNAGLGLASMRGRARILHARLRIHSEPGRGSRIELDIPVTEPAESSDVFEH